MQRLVVILSALFLITMAASVDARGKGGPSGKGYGGYGGGIDRQAQFQQKLNLSDEQIKGIAATGGVIGIGYWNAAVCGEDAAAIARAIRYTVDLVGTDHVSLGSDFDGAVPVPFDTTGLALIAQALLEDGFTKEEIRGIMGENAMRIFEQILPE